MVAPGAARWSVEVLFKKTVQKDLTALSKKDQKRVIEAIFRALFFHHIHIDLDCALFLGQQPHHVLVVLQPFHGVGQELGQPSGELELGA
jgi:hypothetical protein